MLNYIALDKYYIWIFATSITCKFQSEKWILPEALNQTFSLFTVI